MADDQEILRRTDRILLIDYPGRIVPDTLARAGFEVTAHEGPGPNEYCRYLVEDGEVVKSDGGPAPTAADLVFSHRPFDEFGPILEEAVRLGATALWQHGEFSSDESRQAEAMVTAAGLAFIDQPYILDAVAEVRG